MCTASVVTSGRRATIELVRALGCYRERREGPEDIHPALKRARHAIDDGRTAMLNVLTDSSCRAKTGVYARYRT